MLAMQRGRHTLECEEKAGIFPRLADLCREGPVGFALAVSYAPALLRWMTLGSSGARRPS